MAMIQPVLTRLFSPVVVLLLLSSHLLFNTHHSCLALRYVAEPDNSDLDALIDSEASANQRELDYLTSLNRQLHESNSAQQSNRNTNEKLKQFPQPNDNVPWNVDTANSYLEPLLSDEIPDEIIQKQRRNDTLFLVIVGTCTIVGILGLVAAAIFWYKIQKRAEAALDSDYPSYGVPGPSSSGSNKISPSTTMSDRKLAQSAQMFHYQQQRQQMMAQEKAHLDTKPAHSDESDDETPANGDYTVYECPGLAPTGEMEVRNPLFTEPDPSSAASTSVSHPTTNNHYPQLSTSTQDK